MNLIPRTSVEISNLPLISGIIWLGLIVLIPILLIVSVIIKKNNPNQMTKLNKQNSIRKGKSNKTEGFD